MLKTNLDGEKWNQRHFIFLGSKITMDGDCIMKLKALIPSKKSYDKPRQCIKRQ